MAEEDRESRTEAPTEKKITDAIERGNVPFSREAPIFASVSAMLLVGAFLAKDFVGSIAALLVQLVAWDACKFTLAPLAVFAAAGVLSSVAQNAPRLAFDRIQPNLKRI